LYLQAGLFHLALRLVGSTSGFGVTLRACALASAPVLLAVLPWVGWLGWLWSLVLLVFALSRSHSLSIPRAVWSVAAPIMLSVGIAFGLRTFIVEAFKIPGGSMSPTLLSGDHIFVEKYAYAGGELPERGEVVVFEYPYSEPGAPLDFVKRVVGLPGDELVFKGGLLSINGQPVPTCLVGRARLPGTPADAEFDIYVERLGASSHLLALQSGMSGGPQGPYLVSAGEVWMAGDNRANSSDSRLWIPTGGATPGAGVPPSYIKGRAAGVWFPAARSWTSVNGDPTLPPELSELTQALASCLPK
jgi:signal peptidase I